MRSLRPLTHFLRPYLLWVALGPAFMALEVAADLMQPRLLQRIVDVGIARSDFDTVQHTGLLMLLLALFGVFAGGACTVFATLAAQNFGADVRRALFAKVLSFSFGNLDHLESGALITRLTNDVNQVQEVVLLLLRVMVRVPLLLVGSLILAVLTSPRLALLFIPLIPFVVVVLVWIIQKTYPLFALVQKRLDALNTVVQENLSGVRVVKAFAREDREAGRFGGANTQLMDTNIAAARLGALTMPLMMMALNAGVVATLWLGGVRVIGGEMEVGRIIAFVNYLTQTLMSLMMVSMLIVRLSRAEASGVRIGDILNTRPLIEPPANARVPDTVAGRVEFEKVSFFYEGEGDPALKEISFVAQPGQTIAVVGATGSGKSTLVSLIPRFYDATKGRVTLDGVDVRNWEESALHGAVGVALQEAILFSGTIRDTIRYGKPAATDAEVVGAARLAQAQEFIDRLADGYDTRVEARGVNLSGGQKQRLAIARALLPHPQVLILDDSTSAVDVATEARIRQALAQDTTNQTRFIVAQRVSAIRDADLILVLDDGCLVGQGTHEELMESNPVYREIYESQQESADANAEMEVNRHVAQAHFPGN
ncbi:putative ABC transporter ATP-binding protein [Abditibacteriota bacterium]|nr:putative ABC transporter ATP-binding protein [Abditibacteriota bacterium]